MIAEGLAHNRWTDVYHAAMTASWPALLGALGGLFLAMNAFFALVYLLGRDPVANARPGSFLDLFFFSVETISTTGYGDMHPQSLFGHTVAAFENFVSLVATAAMTGLVFARFSRPRARLLFARHPVVSRHNGVDTLMLRVVNARSSFISEATAKLWMLSPTVTAEGQRFVGFRPMRLLRTENPAFALSWTLFHPIDADSPLHGYWGSLPEDVNFVVSFSGVDENSVQVMHARQAYTAEALRWGHEFLDMFRRDADGRTIVDFAKIHETQPLRK